MNLPFHGKNIPKFPFINLNNNILRAINYNQFQIYGPIRGKFDSFTSVLGEKLFLSVVFKI